MIARVRVIAGRVEGRPSSARSVPSSRFGSSEQLDTRRRYDASEGSVGECNLTLAFNKFPSQTHAHFPQAQPGRNK